MLDEVINSKKREKEEAAHTGSRRNTELDNLHLPPQKYFPVNPTFPLFPISSVPPAGVVVVLEHREPFLPVPSPLWPDCTVRPAMKRTPESGLPDSVVCV